MPYKVETLISEIQQKAAALTGEEKKQYLRGLRDGADVSSLICEDNSWKLAANPMFLSFLDFLDKEV